MLIVGAFEQVAGELPFAMLGVDSDNDSAFMSESVFDYCKGHGLVQTRSRAQTCVSGTSSSAPWALIRRAVLGASPKETLINRPHRACPMHT